MSVEQASSLAHRVSPVDCTSEDAYRTIMSRRSPETLADYLAIAVCPFLIFLLVASLMFFLVEVFYQGEYKLRLQFVMAMFCMAIVCIARIAMEEGSSYATLFAFPLGVAVGIRRCPSRARRHRHCLPLMGIVWWAAHKLTWDCTLVDDSQEASGQGLLQEMGLDPLAAGVPSGPAGTTTRPQLPEATTGQRPARKPWWEKLLEPDPPAALAGRVGRLFLAGRAAAVWRRRLVRAGQRARRPAREFFNIWSSMSPAAWDSSGHELSRPAEVSAAAEPGDACRQMTATWIAVGGGLIVATLIFAAILPRHEGRVFAGAVAHGVHFGGPQGQPLCRRPRWDERHVQPRRGTDRRPGRPVVRPRGRFQRREQERQIGEIQIQGQGQRASPAANRATVSKAAAMRAATSRRADSKAIPEGRESPADKGSANQASKSQQGGESSAETGEVRGPAAAPGAELEQSRRSSQTESPPGAAAAAAITSRPFSNFNISQALFTLLKGLFYLALLIAVLVAGWIYREQLAAAWQKLLAELRELWARWFGDKPKQRSKPRATESARTAAAVCRVCRSVRQRRCPRMPWPELVRHSFAAVEAWAREHDCPRHADQTPHEFAQSLAAAGAANRRARAIARRLVRPTRLRPPRRRGVCGADQAALAADASHCCKPNRNRLTRSRRRRLGAAIPPSPPAPR